MFRMIIIILITLLFSTILTFVTGHSINQLTWINSLFYCSLLLTVVGGAMLVLQGGFFNGAVRSFKHFFQKPNRMEQIMDDMEGGKEYVRPYRLTFKLSIPFLLAGILLLIFSIFFSWVISV